MRYIYLDETEFILEGVKWFGYGALITNQPIEQNLIDEALSYLKKFKDNGDPDFKDKDDKTLQNKYFHASEDFLCAHCSICKQIENIDGVFCAELVKSIYPEDLMKSSLWASISGMSSPETTILIYENRENLNNLHIEKLIEEHQIYMLHNIDKFMYTPIYFPQLGYKITDKTEPGLQLVDFILWAYQRSLCTSDDWLKKIEKNRLKTTTGFTIKMETKPENGKNCFCNITINKGIKEYLDQINLYNNTKISCTDKVSQSLIKQLIMDVYATLHKTFSDGVIKGNKYLNEELGYAVNNIAQSPGNLFTIFLKLFDSLSFLDENHSDQINELWLTYKKLVAESFNFENKNVWELRHKQFDNAWQELINENFFKE